MQSVAGGAKYQAAKPLSQRVKDNAFHRFAQEIVFRRCYQRVANNCRQDCCSGLRKRVRAAIREDESGIKNRVRFTSMLQPLHTS